MTHLFVALAFVCQTGLGCFTDVAADYFKTKEACLEFNKEQIIIWSNNPAAKGARVFTTCVEIQEPKELPKPGVGV